MILATKAIVPSKPTTGMRLSLETHPDPVQVSPQTGDTNHATLVVVADAPPGKPTAVDQVVISLPVGKAPCTGPAYLTCDVGAVHATATPSTAWRLLPLAGDGLFRFVRPDGVDPKVVDQSYTFSLANIPVSQIVGTSVITFIEQYGDPDDDDYVRRTGTFEVSKFPPDFAPVTFSSTTTAVDPGGTATLRWQGGPARYQMSWAGQPAVDVTNVPGWVWTTPPLTTGTTFRLEVSTQSDGVTVSRSYDIRVDVLTPEVTLTGDTDHVRAGDAVTLSWTTANVSDLKLIERKATGGLTPKETALSNEIQQLTRTPSSNTEYQLKARTHAGTWIESSPFSVEVSEPAPKATSDLWLLQPRGDKVQLTVADGATRFQTVHSATTGLSASEMAAGAWEVFPANDRVNAAQGLPDVVLIKTTNTDSGLVERHVAYRNSGSRPIFSDVGVDSVQFPLALARSGTWTPLNKFAVALIQVVGTRSGQVEYQWAKIFAAVPGFHSVVTRFGIDQGGLGTWKIADLTGGGTHDMVLIKTKGTTRGKVEIHTATRESGFQTGSTWETGFDADDADLGTWHLTDMNPNKAPGQMPDLVLVKTKDTATGFIEIYFADAESKYQTVVGGYTGISTTETADAVWGVTRYYRPGVPPL
jgi:hypothetical protein